MQPVPSITPAVSTERLAHGFKRTLFGFPASFRRNSSQDKYGYLFETESPAAVIPYSEVNHQLLENLGRQMIDAPGPEEPAGFSTIDSGYTYFGQFVDHDLTFDVDSSTSKAQNAR